MRETLRHTVKIVKDTILVFRETSQIKNLSCRSSGTNASKSCGNFFCSFFLHLKREKVGFSECSDDLPQRSLKLKHLQHPANQNTRGGSGGKVEASLTSFASLSISGRSRGAGNTQAGLIKGLFHLPPPHPLTLASLTWWRRSAFQRC